MVTAIRLQPATMINRSDRLDSEIHLSLVAAAFKELE